MSSDAEASGLDFFGAMADHLFRFAAAEQAPDADYQGCPCGPMSTADGYVYGCPVHDPNPPKGTDR